ncbi:MAG: phage portal protein [Planctomycetota bacterium]|jgi:HK97 family phage portal protein
MGFLVRTSARSGDPLENPNLPLNDPDAWDDVFDGFSGKTDSGIKVSPKAALTLSALWRGASLIANTCGRVPLHVMQIGDGELDKTKAKDHAAWSLCRRSWVRNRISAFEGRRTLTLQAVMRGNGYAAIVRNPKTAAPSELLPLKPGYVTPVVANGHFLYVVSVGGSIEDPNSELRRLDASDVLHIHGPGSDGLSGHSIIDLGREDFGRMLATRKHHAKFFANAATPKVVLQTPSTLSDKAFARLLKTWQQMKAGLDNSHKTAILEEGTTVETLTVSPADAQLLESEKFSLTQAANWLGLPVHKVGGEGRTAFASLAEENQSTLDEAFDPWLIKWETECWEKLLTEEQKQAESHEVEFKRQALLRMNPGQRAAFYRSAVGGPFMLRNEARAAENLPPVDGFEEPITPTNLAGGTKGVGDVKKADPNPQQNSGDDGVTPRAQQCDNNVTPPAAQRDAVEQLLNDTARRMAKRLIVHAARRAATGRPATPDLSVVRDALRPFEPLVDRNAEALAGLIANAVEMSQPIEDEDETARSVAEHVVATVYRSPETEDPDDEE